MAKRLISEGWATDRGNSNENNSQKGRTGALKKIRSQSHAKAYGTFWPGRKAT